jgi:hypothetical protein
MVLAATVSMAGRAVAGTIYWDAGSGSGILAPTSTVGVAGTITAGDMSRGNNQGSESLNNSTSASSGYSFDLNGTTTAASGRFNFGADTLVGATLDIATSTYFSFTITPDAGTNFEITSIGFGSRSTTNGPQAWTLRSSADSFATDLVVPGTLSNNSTWNYATAAFASPFSASAATEFRLYGYAVDGPQSFVSNTWRIDDVQVQVVPEPTALVMFAAGAACLAGRRRLRRRPVAKGRSAA